MKATKLLQLLISLIAEHGDFDVLVEGSNFNLDFAEHERGNKVAKFLLLNKK